MSTFFVEHENISEDTIKIAGSEYNHIKNVLRLKNGSVLTVSSGDAGKYTCTIEEFDEKKETVICKIKEKIKTDTELPIKVTVFQGLPKGDKMETVVRRNVELGVYGIVPVNMERTIVKLDEKKKKSRLARWNTISESAAQQSGRMIIPEVSDILDFKEAAKKASRFDKIIVPYECANDFSHTKTILESISTDANVAVFIGPEGGFSSEEISILQNSGSEIITLGKRILRTETAAIMLMSIFNYLFEN